MQDVKIPVIPTVARRRETGSAMVQLNEFGVGVTSVQ
jgi:hypothetical protein